MPLMNGKVYQGGDPIQTGVFIQQRRLLGGVTTCRCLLVDDLPNVQVCIQLEYVQNEADIEDNNTHGKSLNE
jgi:hypothetical protein